MQKLMRPQKLLTAIALLFASCNSTGDLSESNLQSLYCQRIPGSSLVVYEYNFAGQFVTSSDRFGWALLDSSALFSEENIDELPARYFLTRPRGDHFSMLDIDDGEEPATQKDTLLTPITQYTKQVRGICIDVSAYRNTYGSATTSTGLMEYGFDGLSETRDSLTLFKVNKKFGGRSFPATAAFMKGNIKVIDSGGYVKCIDIQQAVIQRGEVYKPGKPFELVPDQPVVGMATYSFYPARADQAF